MKPRPPSPRPTRKSARPTGTPREFNVVIERDQEGWYIASVPELPGCHTQARSLDILMRRIREAVAAYIESTPATIPGSTFVGLQRIAV